MKKKKIKNKSIYKEISIFIKNLKNYPLTKQQIKTLKGQAINGDLLGAEKGLNTILKKVATSDSFGRRELFRKAHMDTDRLIKQYGGCYKTQFEICLKNAYAIINVTREVIK